MERYDHLLLPFNSSQTKRRSTSGGKPFHKRAASDKVTASDRFVQSFNKIKKENSLLSYHNPKLIFKLELNQKVDDREFRKNLEEMDIEILGPTQFKEHGYWVVFSSDNELIKFREKLEKYKTGEFQYNFFDPIENLIPIDRDEKIGKRLRESPFHANEISNIEIELWRLPDNLMNNIETEIVYLLEGKGEILDRYSSENLYKLLIKTSENCLDSLLSMPEVKFADRPLIIEKIDISEDSIQHVEVINKPRDEAKGILILDTGIISNHPLFQGIIGDEFSSPTLKSKKIRPEFVSDDVGHGTQVAGVAAFGDLKKSIQEGNFKCENWIYSCKIMFKSYKMPEEGEIDVEELVEHQLDDAIKNITENHENCKIINVSFGDAHFVAEETARQFAIALVIDDLCQKYDILFVISSGNSDNCSNYPRSLLNDPTCKIIDPGTSFLGLTVGATTYIKENTRSLLPSMILAPSPLTRTGPGLYDIVKPEIVEYGSGGPDDDGVITTNKDFFQRRLTKVKGSSFSAPKVANLLGKIMNKFPNRTINFYKALLLSSTEYPTQDNEILKEFTSLDMLNVFGYGIPNIDKSLYSFGNRVLLYRDNNLKVGEFHVYQLELPYEFFQTDGTKKIICSLVFNPITRYRRKDYIGTKMDVILYKDSTTDEVISRFGDEEEPTGNVKSISSEIPSSRVKLGCNQKYVFDLSKRRNLQNNLVVRVNCYNKFVEDDFVQDYCIIVILVHSLYNELYSRIDNIVKIQASA